MGRVVATGCGVVAERGVEETPPAAPAGLTGVALAALAGGVGVGYFDLIGVAVGVPGTPLEPGWLVTRGALAIVTIVARRMLQSIVTWLAPSLSVTVRLASRIRPLALFAGGIAAEIRRVIPP